MLACMLIDKHLNLLNVNGVRQNFQIRFFNNLIILVTEKRNIEALKIRKPRLPKETSRRTSKDVGFGAVINLVVVVNVITYRA